MKLVIFISSLAGGGAERVTANLASYWAERGWDVTVLTMAPSEDDRYALHNRVRRSSLNLSGTSVGPASALWQNARRLFALRRELKRLRPDGAIGMMVTSNVLLALASRGLGIRAIGSERVHPPRVPLGTVWEQLRAWSYGLLDMVVVQTEETGAWLRAHTAVRRIAIIPNAVRWPLPKGDPEVNPAAHLRANARRLIAVGRLTKQKGFDLLIAAFATIAPTLPDWDLVIIGEGPERASLEGDVQRYSLQGRVSLPGQVGNMGDWYQVADVFVLSSRFEGFPNSLVEALSYGLPAVSFDCDTGPRDIIRPGVEGLLVCPNDVGALAQAAARLMSDPVFRSRCSTEAVKVRERFSMDRVSKLWSAILGPA